MIRLSILYTIIPQLVMYILSELECLVRSPMTLMSAQENSPATIFKRYKWKEYIWMITCEWTILFRGPMTAASGLYGVPCNIIYNPMSHWIRDSDSMWSCRVAGLGAHCSGGMIIELSHLGNGISFADGTSSLRWVGPQNLLYLL